MSKTQLNYNVIKNALELNNGDIQKSAEYLNVKYNTLYWWIKCCNLPYKSKKTPITATKEQIEEAYTRLQSLRKVAKELGCTSEGLRVAMRRLGIYINKPVLYSCDHDFFKRENEDVFYWAGFIAADGCVRQRKNSKKELTNSYDLYIGLALKDLNHLQKFKKCINFNGPIHNIIGKNSLRNHNWNDSKKVELRITSKTIFDDLSKFNIVPRKTHIYTFPEWLKKHQLVHHFMRGYFDGDGSLFFSKQKNKSDQLFFSLRGTSQFLTDYRSILENNCNLKKRNKPIRISCNTGILEYGEII